MKLSALLAPLLDAKADHEIIRKQILAYEAEQADALEKRRAADAARQSRKRNADKSRDVTLRHSDRLLTGASVTRVDDKTLTLEIEPQGKKVSKARACRLPSDFSPDLDWAVAHGLTPSQAQAEFAKFRDYWSGKGANATKTDWPATWRNWVRQALERQPTARGSPAQQAPSMSQLLQVIRDQPSENQSGPPEDRSSLRPAIPHLRTVGTG